MNWRLFALLGVLGVAACESVPIDAGDDRPALEAPSSVRAAGQDRSILVSWVAPAEIQDFRIYVGTTPDELEAVQGVEASPVAEGSRSWEARVEGLSNGTTYYVAVTAFLDRTESEPSTTVSVATPSLTAPTIVDIESSNGEVAVHWTSELERFKVYVGPEPEDLTIVQGAEVTQSWMSSDAWQSTVSGLSNGETYYFSVSALLGEEESELSEPVPAMPVAHACQAHMIETRDTYGAPEEINAYDASDYHSHGWWYWSRGWQINFTWGRYISGCDISTYTFTPIP